MDTPETPKAPVGMIRPNEVALRKVNKDSVKFQEIVQSIPKCGILNPVSVQARVDEETGEEYFELVDGLHRYSAACEAGLEEIPIHIVSLGKVDSLIAQFHANYAKVETKSSEFTKQLVRILEECKTLTEAELADMTGFSITTIRNYLKLKSIEDQEILSMIDDGKIPMQNAYALASLPTEEHEAFKEQAVTEAPQQFLALVKACKKKLKEAKNQAKGESNEFPGATPHLRPLKELKGVVEDKAPVMQYVNADMSPVQIVDAVLSFVMKLDPQSQAEAKAKWEANQARRVANTERKAVEKAEQTAEKKADAAKKAEAEAKEAAKTAKELAKGNKDAKAE